MNRFRLATTAILAGVLAAAGCASPCGGCGGGMFSRMSMFRSRAACPCECCSNNIDGGVPIVGAAGPMMGEGPLLDSPDFSSSPLPPPMAPPSGLQMPGPMPNLGVPTVPADPGRILPIPGAASPVPAQESSRLRR